MTVGYTVEAEISADEFVEILRRSGLAERRPVEQLDRIRRMVENANLIVCARDDGRLVGVARSVTDFAYCCFLSDLAVDRAYQRRGVGRELIRITRQTAGEECTLLLLSAPAAMEFYAKLGMRRAGNAWAIDRPGRPERTGPDESAGDGR
jgi:GNAT superfamily N-acetyltransferase